ncbi:hypothetical protein VPH35_029807 [Triticum aestivum]
MANLAEAGYVFQPTGRELVGHYLMPRAGLGGFFLPGIIEEGVDVLSLRPRALSFPENHRRDYSEVQYGQEKAYYGGEGGREAVAFRRRFAYRYTWRDGEVIPPTRWRMKEYRLNRNAAAFRRAHPGRLAADEAADPSPPPPPVDSSSSDDEGSESYIVYLRLDELMRRLTLGN